MDIIFNIDILLLLDIWDIHFTLFLFVLFLLLTNTMNMFDHKMFSVL